MALCAHNAHAHLSIMFLQHITVTPDTVRATLGPGSWHRTRTVYIVKPPLTRGMHVCGFRFQALTS